MTSASDSKEKRRLSAAPHESGAGKKQGKVPPSHGASAAKKHVSVEDDGAHSGSSPKKDSVAAGPKGSNSSGATKNQEKPRKSIEKGRKSVKAEIKPPPTSNNTERWQKILNIMDKSGDGIIDEAEFIPFITTLSAFSPSLNTDFSTWDTDNDGGICLSELIKLMDGVLSMLGERAFAPVEVLLVEEVQEMIIAEQQDNNAWALLSTAAETTDACDPVEELEKAMRTTDARTIRKAIRDAQSCGVDRKMIKDAKQVLKQQEAHEKLEEALESGDAGILRIALRELKREGVPQEEYNNAENMVSVFAARTAITKAIQKKDPDALLKGLEKGQKFLEKEELDNFRLHLPPLKAEDQLKWAMANENPEDIEMALTDALRLEVDGDIVQQAQSQLPRIRERFKMKAKLEQAIMSGSSQSIREIVNLASDLHVTGQEMDRALFMVRKMEAREQLEKAVEKEQSRHLRSAIDNAKEAGIEPSVIENAERVLQRIDIQTNLRAALVGDDLPEVRALVKATHEFIAQGWAVGVKAELLSKAEFYIKTMDEAQAALKSG